MRVAMISSLRLSISAGVLAALAIAPVSANSLDTFPTTPAPAGMGVVQALAYLSLLAAVGLIWFRAFVVGDIDAGSRRLSLQLSVATIVLHIILAGYIHVWSESLTARSLLAAEGWDISPKASSVRAIVSLVIGLPLQYWFARSTPTGWKRNLAVFLGGLIALGSLTVVGHTATLEPTWLTHGAVFVHGAAATFWFGGVLGLVLYFRQAFADRSDVAGAGGVLTRFSSLALWVVVALAVSGVVMSASIKDNPLDFTGTPFARTLTLKLMIVAIPIVLAVYNRFSLMPRLKENDDTDDAWNRLRSVVLVEFAALMLVVIITGFLVLKSPVA